MNNTGHYDVVVIGGGPAGAATATLLSQKGHRVVLLEKERFPRYHVGESMIPYCYFVLDKLGMIEVLEKTSFTRKYSVQFASSSGRLSQPFYFQEHLKHPASATWQVDRAEFDELLLQNARSKGVTVLEETTVKRAIEYDGVVQGVVAVDAAGAEHRFFATITIDASGRNGFFATRNAWRVPDERLRKVSIWTYYKAAKRDPGIDEGATTVAYLPENGWFWYIPLKDDKVSVGVVADKSYLYRESRDAESIFLREVQNNRWIAGHLAPGSRSEEYRVTGDYSYRSRYCAADGVVLTGDAFAFLDPVFSTGLLLALHGGDMAAEAVDLALKKQNVSAAQFEAYGEELCRGLEAMRKLVYSFYDQEFNFRAFFGKYPDSRDDVTDCLIGRLDRDYTVLFERIAEFAEVPADLVYGKPLVRSADSVQSRQF